MREKKEWNIENIPDQTDKVAIVTGANSGIGFEVAKTLAHKGAQVIMACRNMEKSQIAQKKIFNEFPGVKIEFIHLDLSNLSSVREFVGKFREKFSRLDILCNNAGVMMTPQQKTADGFELQFGTNYLGHFALTGLLLKMLLKIGNSRIVSMSSVAHKYGEINFEDLNWENRGYDRLRAYTQSKLAILLFVYELQRKLENLGYKVISNASHPGWARTDLAQYANFMRLLTNILGVKPEKGALSMIYAATAPEANGGAYYGPDGRFELSGYPIKVQSTERSHNLEDAKRLWKVSEELTQIRYPI